MVSSQRGQAREISSAPGELEGFDLDQHGASAYPEYVISTLTKSHSVGGDMEDNALTSAPVAAQ